MDTFSHILIAFLLVGKFDLNLAFFAGVMALIIDLDVFLFPLTKKYPNFQHRGLVHSVLGVICVTLVAAFIFSSLSGLNYWLCLGAGLIGAYSHTTCDTLTNYGTLTLWPFLKRYVKADINPGISPITTIVSTVSIPFLYYSYEGSNFVAFNNVYLLASLFFIIYFIIRFSLKSYVQLKFHTHSIPNFNPFRYKLIQVSQHKEGDQDYKEIKWRTVNLLTGKFNEEGQIHYLITNPAPPLDTDEKMIAFSHKTTPIQRILTHSDYHIYELMGKNDDNMIISWFALEFTMGKWRMGATIDLKRDGTYKMMLKYPSLTRH